MPSACFSPGCKTGYNTDRKKAKSIGVKVHSMFLPPKNPVIFALWQKAIPRADRKLTHKNNICEIHFKEEDILRSYGPLTLFDGTVWSQKRERPVLKPGAIPCYFPNVPGYSNSPSKEKADKRKNLPRKKKKRGRKKAKIDEFIENESEEPKEVFLSSKEKENVIVNLVNCQPSTIDECSVSQSELGTYVKTEFPGEAPVQIPQSVLRANLSTTSQLSSPQHNDPDNLSIQSQVNPMDALAEAAQVIFNQENFGEPQEIVTDPSPEDNSADEHEVVLPQSVLDEQFSFPFIKVNINMIDKQNSMWTINEFETFIICARWNSDYVVERKIVIKDDLTVKVFLKERPTTIGNDLKLVSIENISKLIYRVERATICPEICNNEGKCHGFLQGTYICRKRNICEGCIKWEKEKVIEEKRRLLEEKRIAQKQVELIRFHFNV